MHMAQLVAIFSSGNYRIRHTLLRLVESAAYPVKRNLIGVGTVQRME